MAWTETEAAPAFKDCKDRKGRAVEGADRFGPMLSVAGAGISPKRPPRLPLRLMVSLPYPEHAFDQNDGDGSIGCAVVSPPGWVKQAVGAMFSVVKHLPAATSGLARFSVKPAPSGF